jgi:sec-independent protein translocase protein TatA
MFDVGGGELLLILLAILLLFGPKKIPELSNMLGKGLRELRKAQSDFQSQINEIKTEIDNTSKIDIIKATEIVEHKNKSINNEHSIIEQNIVEENQPALNFPIDTTKKNDSPKEL